MNIGIDIDKTLTHHPDFYKELMDNWTVGRVYLLTGRCEFEREETIKMLSLIGVSGQYDEMLMYPYKYFSGDVWEKFSDVKGSILDDAIGAWKALMCLDNNITVMFDDNDKFVEHMRKAGVYVLHSDKDFK